MGSTTIQVSDRDSSDSIQERIGPAASKSRQVQHRTFPPVRRERLKRHEEFRRKRLERVVDEGKLELSSDEENFTSALASAGHGGERCSLPNISCTIGNSQNGSRLQHLPRPSDVVRNSHLDEAVNGEANEERRKRRERRLISSVLLLEHLNSRGGRTPVPTWTLDREGLNRYTQFLVPPKEDQFLQESRVPKHLLSCSFRGSLLAVRRLGSRAKRSKRTRSDQHRSSSTHPNSVGVKGDSCMECLSVVDDEHWATTSDFSDTTTRESVPTATGEKTAENSKKSNQTRTKHSLGKSNATVETKDSKELSGDQATPKTRDKEKEAFLNEILKESTSSSSNSSDSDDSEPASNVNIERSTKDVGNGVQDSTRESPEHDLFGALMEKASKDPDSVFRKVDKLVDIRVDHGHEPVDSATPGEVSEGALDTTRKPNKLSKFELEKRKAAIFTTGGRNPKRRRQDFRRQVREDRGKLRRRSVEKPISQDATSRVSKMMKKMGFTGRLGAREQGIAVPVLPNENPGRSGLGARASNATMDADIVEPPVNLMTERHVTRGVTDAEINVGRSEIVKKRSRARHKGRSELAGMDREVVTKELSRNETGGQVGSVQDLDADDEYETSLEDKAVDNSRRGILVDADVLIKNTHQRRIQAFQIMVDKSTYFEQSFDVKAYFQSETRDLCDADYIHDILKSHNVEPTPETCEAMHRELDQAFLAGEAPECNSDAISLLRVFQRDMFLGLFHRGSQNRLNVELEAMGFGTYLFECPCVLVRTDQKWPYVKAWQDLLCRVGVRSNQSIFWVEKDADSSHLSGSLLACTMLDARWMQAECAKGEWKVRVMGLRGAEDIEELSFNASSLNTYAFLGPIMESPKRRRKRRRVLALRPKDGLWYCGLEEVSAQTGSKNHRQSLIRFHGQDDLEWIDQENVATLARKHFRKVSEAGFPGILEPEDVASL